MTHPVDTSRIEAARRAERRNNAFAREIAKENSTDASGKLVPLTFLERIHQRAKWAEEGMAWLREQKCPSCQYGSDEAKACTSLGCADGFRGAPMCKWASRAAVDRQEQDLTGERLQRL